MSLLLTLDRFMILREKSSPTCREVVFLIFHVIAVILIRRCTTVWIHDRFKLKYVCTCKFYLTCDTMAKSTDIHSADFCWLLLLKQNKGFLMLAMFQDNIISLQCWVKEKLYLNHLSANPTKWSNTLKKFVGNSRQIVWMCLTFCGVGA